MFQCKVINLFFTIFPLKAWQSLLIRHHIQSCLNCQNKLASIDEAKSLFLLEGDEGSLERQWLSIKGKLKDEKRKGKLTFRPRLRWIAGAAGFFAAIALGIWLYLSLTPDKSFQETNLAERFRINYIRVENKPAKTFLFRPHDSKMIIIWAEKNS